MNRLLAILVSMALGVMASAVTLEVSPGRLSALVTDADGVRSLVLRGSADARDLYFVAEQMTSLDYLDMSSVAIVPYYGRVWGRAESFASDFIPEMCFAGSRLKELRLPGGVETGRFAFAGSALRAVSLGDGTVVGDGSFAGCAMLGEVVFGTGAVVGDASFESCSSLEAIDLNGAVSVGRSAFEECGRLERVTGTECLTMIGDCAFNGCGRLDTFAFGAALGYVGSSSFAGTALERADMRACVRLREVGAWAFSKCISLCELAFPPQLAVLGAGVAFSCGVLDELELPDAVAELPDFALSGAESLVSLSFSDMLRVLGQYALCGMSQLRAVRLPASLSVLGDGAMEGVTSLATVDASSLRAVPDTGSDVWYGVDAKRVSLIVDSGMEPAFAAAEQWRDFVIRSVESGIREPVAAGNIISVYFAGDNLMVESTGAPLASIELYTPGGVMLERMRLSGDCAEVYCPVAPGIYIVSSTCADNTRYVSKVIKK